MTTDVRVRIAPSPTGFLHVGTARTALFVWLFARKHHGTFILRIEDTDLERSSEDMTRGILESLKWLGLDWDEGPYLQSARSGQHRDAAARLLESGQAYRCFCSPELIDQKRKEAAARKLDFKYDRTCLHLSADEVRSRLERGEKGAVRFKVPAGSVSYHDAVLGDITVESETIEDFVLLRSDGSPTYHLGVVVDDIDMRISHVIRGSDHISNTPKQTLLYKAMNAPLPVFAHVPLILGPDKTKLSKRHGATSVSAYAEQGLVPEAFRNFLALLGWSPGNDRELFDTDELIEAFSLEGISKANAVFNPEKLAWFNLQYIQKLPDEKLVAYLKPEFEKAGLWRDAFQGERYAWFCSMLTQLRPRAKTLLEFPKQAKMFIVDQLDFDPAAVEKFLKDPAMRANLATFADRLAALAEFDHQSVEAATRSLAEQLGIKPGALMGAARVALTGQSVSPGLFEVMLILGRDRTVARLKAAATIAFLP
jgi:glutamyl-tRNA synthetase